MSAVAPLEPAWVLHTRPYRETSQIADLLTAEFGRVDVVVRGARGRRRGGTATRQFMPLLVSWSGRGSLKTLRTAEADGAPLALAGDALLAGLYVNELLLRVLRPMDPHEGLHAQYGRCLRGLNQPGSLAPALRQFERELLAAIGYAVSFTHASDGQAVVAGRQYAWVEDTGFVPLERAPAGQGAQSYCGSALLAIAGNDYSRADTREQARRLFRALLEPYLGGQPLRSSRLMAASRHVGNKAGERSQADAQ